MPSRQFAPLALALLFVLGGSAHAQKQESPFLPEEDLSGAPVPAAPVPVVPCPPEEAPLAEGDPRPFRPLPGWFAGVDAFLVQPQYHSVSDQGISRAYGPSSHWTVAPEGILGYQFEGGNALLVSYRYIGTSARDDNASVLSRTSLDIHALDFDYRGCTHQPLPSFTWFWQAGCRFNIIDTDSRGQSLSDSNHLEMTFVGAGPHLGGNLSWYPGQGCLGFFARADLGALVGGMRSLYEYHELPGPFAADTAPFSDHHTHWDARVVLNPRAELGASWTPATQRWLRLEGGVRVDEFILFASDYNSALLLHNLGPFLRCECQF